MNMIDILLNRRSIRKYKNESIPDDKINTVLKAGLLSASSRGKKPWELIVVKNKDTLKKLSQCRVNSAKMLEGADCAIVVIADSEKTDVWVEDCSIVMSNMHLLASSIGLGSCWIQCRLREAENGQPTEEYLRNLLNFPTKFKAEAILSLGVPQTSAEPHSLDDLPTEKIHYDEFNNIV